MTERVDLGAKVQQWLEKVGYAFELRVGRQLATLGWTVSHARYYRDPVLNKTRELDILAGRVQTESNDLPICGVGLAIECKTSSKPWVVFSAPKSGIEGLMPSQYVIGKYTQALLLDIGIPTQTKAKLFMLDSVRRFGHGVAQVNFQAREKRNAAYGAIRSAVAATTAVSAANELLYGSLKWPFVQFLFPIVVFDGRLFETYLDHEGQESLLEIDYAQVLAPRLDVPNQACIVNIVTPSAIQTLAKNAAADLATLETLLKPRADRMQILLKGLATSTAPPN